MTRLDHLDLKDDHHLLGVGGVADVLLDPDDGVLFQLVLLDDSLVTVYMRVTAHLDEAVELGGEHGEAVGVFAITQQETIPGTQNI